MMKVTFSIVDENKRYLARLRNLIAENYETPTCENRKEGDDDTLEQEVYDEDDEGLDIKFQDDEEETY